ncbi:hypothetical protein ACETRX_23545 [Labrys portucalensis]|uniref:Transcriptional regulator n=1 Tax=Labrys neptuniae TaxID=376174 RepID=A0ABV6ZKB6_9HYPH
MTDLVPSEEKRQAFYDDVRKAWDEYQATGLHVTGEEVAAWLETWGTDDNKASPVCHRQYSRHPVRPGSRL